MTKVTAKKYKLVTVIGNIGVGKSTLTDLLTKHLPAKQVPADSLFKVNPFFPLAVNDRARWSLTSDIWFLKERIKIAQTIPEKLKKSHVVVDSGLPMSFVYANSRVDSGYFTDEEWKLYKEIHDALVTTASFPGIVIYLKAPVPFILKRIEERGREFELRYYTGEYLDRLAKSLVKERKQLKARRVKVIDIDATRHDFVNDEKDLQAIIKAILR